MGTAIRFLGLAGLGLMVLLATGWGTLAIGFLPQPGATLRTVLQIAFAIAGLAAIVCLSMPRRRWRVLGIFVASFGALLIAWNVNMQPSNDRDWRSEEAVLAYATFEGNQVTLHNIRNFAYRSENNFTPAYYDKTFDLDRLDAVDVGASYWMGPHIAHIFLSFGFGDDHLAVSIEARKEKGEGYSTLNGFFRQYELYYVVADERDVIGVRTNFRNDPPEQVYLFPVNVPTENMRRLFLAYLAQINALREQPRFYNTLTTNCTTTIWMNTRVNPGHVKLSWKVLASGHVPEYLYEVGRVDTQVSFDELRRRARVDERARTGGSIDPGFSRRIREAMPLDD